MIKDLDEAIQHCLEVADQKEEDAVWWDKAYQDGYASQEAKECKECAEEHRQLAEWLKELLKFKSLKCKTCNEYDTEENWCYKHGIDRSYDDFCSDWDD